MNFQKEDLEGTHYRWSENEHDVSIFQGQPTRRAFDKSNGDQVLFLINFFCSLSAGDYLSEGRMIEREILYNLPEDAKSEISVINWMRNNKFVEG